MVVKIQRYYSYPNIARQTPNDKMRWGDIVFTENPVDECDYLIILDFPKNDFSIRVPKGNIIHISLEPPNEVSKYRQYANKNVDLIINQLDIQHKNILSHGALPWHIDKHFDFLKSLKVSSLVKEDKIVWVTSNQKASKGHFSRMAFLNMLKNIDNVEIYGRGIKPIEDKWGVLSTSKYGIAYENFSNDYYWTEKLVDCFLSYTMPLYYGCNNISNYFPENSYIQIDPNDKHIKLFIKELLKTNRWERNIDAIKEARELVLYKYQLFPFLYHLIKTIEAQKGSFAKNKTLVEFKGGDRYFDNYPKRVWMEKQVSKYHKIIKNYLN